MTTDVIEDLCGSSRPTFSTIQVDTDTLKINEFVSDCQEFINPNTGGDAQRFTD